MDGSILLKISTKENLKNAWNKILKYDESHGLSGETIATFKSNLENKIESISAELNNGKFKFSPNRAAVIPKDNGKYRPLQIPEIRDRVVLKAIALELEEQFADVIKKSEGISFAYQKRMGVRQALEKVVDVYSSGKQIILETDIINFFGTVNKEWLLTDLLFPKLSDDSLNALIRDGLNQPIQGQEFLSPDQAKLFESVGSGIPQGNPLSPLLSNIYLAGFDQFMITNGFSLIRYADDFIVLCNDICEAEVCYQIVKRYLWDELQLKIHPIEELDKTRIIDPKNSAFSFLSIGFDGVDLYPSSKNYMRLKGKLRDICHSRANSDVLTILTKLRNSLEGWIAAYFYTKVERYAADLDIHIDQQLLLALRRFDWRLTKQSIAKLPSNKRVKMSSGEMLSATQRRNSGVPFCMDLITEKRFSEDLVNAYVNGDLP